MADPDDGFEAQWLEEFQDDTTYSFFYNRRGEQSLGEDPRRWLRDKWVYGSVPAEQGATWELANSIFWTSLGGPGAVQLAGIFQSNIPDESGDPEGGFAYADEPDILAEYWESQLRKLDAELKAHPERGEMFTVVYTWSFGCPPGNAKRGSLRVEGIGWKHAELIARGRAANTAPEVPLLVAAVVRSWQPQLDSGELDVYATQDGQVLPPPSPSPEPRHRRLHLFGHHN